MYPGVFARTTPHKPALVNGRTGATVSYKALDEGSNRVAQFLYAEGLRRGDHIAVFMENDLRYLEIAWATLRSGLHLTPINRYLTAAEAAYIIDDCDAKVLFTSLARREVATALLPLIGRCPIRLMLNGAIDGFLPYEPTVAAQSSDPLPEEWCGHMMLYSSGTTGRPKGIKKPLPQGKPHEVSTYLPYAQLNGYTAETIYLSPAPLYHAAPLGYVLAVQSVGGTAIIMESFEPIEALRLIEKYHVTHGQWVPTMFIRMLKLPEAERRRVDLSSMKQALHAAAPCPVEVKRQMIEWWGPIIEEYYAASEGHGVTRLDSREWLAHPGSVGRAKFGILHICDEDGAELPPGQDGLVYFEMEMLPFQYHKDPTKTAAACHPLHANWSTVGDIGYVDEEGYLYLTDRKAFMIISGGVNIYPQQIEDKLILHPKVADVAVIGVPNEEMGEEVKAVVQLAPGVTPGEAVAAELLAFLEDKIAAYMRPRSIDFVAELPRLPTGKLYKKSLRDRYWTSTGVPPVPTFRRGTAA
jgi:fatty-acyl-CoA synthase